ncbi:hypothetical protein GGS26DRAFT_566929, partial [Hypomontagnella submonticulosa]
MIHSGVTFWGGALARPLWASWHSSQPPDKSRTESQWEVCRNISSSIPVRASRERRTVIYLTRSFSVVVPCR